MIEVSKQELDEAKEAAEQICENINEVIEGHKIGHIIPALIYMLAMMHDKEVMSKERFVKEVSGSVARYIDEFEQESKGEIQWLQ